MKYKQFVLTLAAASVFSFGVARANDSIPYQITQDFSVATCVSTTPAQCFASVLSPVSKAMGTKGLYLPATRIFVAHYFVVPFAGTTPGQDEYCADVNPITLQPGNPKATYDCQNGVGDYRFDTITATLANGVVTMNDVVQIHSGDTVVNAQLINGVFSVSK